jgi:hypothetical protein
LGLRLQCNPRADGGMAAAVCPSKLLPHTLLYSCKELQSITFKFQESAGVRGNGPAPVRRSDLVHMTGMQPWITSEIWCSMDAIWRAQPVLAAKHPPHAAAAWGTSPTRASPALGGPHTRQVYKPDEGTNVALFRLAVTGATQQHIQVVQHGAALDLPQAPCLSHCVQQDSGGEDPRCVTCWLCVQLADIARRARY